MIEFYWDNSYSKCALLHMTWPASFHPHSDSYRRSILTRYPTSVPSSHGFSPGVPSPRGFPAAFHPLKVFPPAFHPLTDSLTWIPNGVPSSHGFYPHSIVTHIASGFQFSNRFPQASNPHMESQRRSILIRIPTSEIYVLAAPDNFVLVVPYVYLLYLI